ncbi:MAG: XRE family transcriptional regulator [Planctomycetota bacterium]|nr:XRE family transcriptional regulator [Planctomycetota bacterium]
MTGLRIKQFRLARGWSLQDLVDKAGNVVTKQAVSKIEGGKSNPTNRVLRALAKALNVPVATLLEDHGYKVDFIAFRKGSRLSRTDEDRIKNTIEIELKDRVRLYSLLNTGLLEAIPYGKYEVDDFKDVEKAAEGIRMDWKLGSNPIQNVTEVLEEHGVHVFFLQVADDTNFDGVSARITDEKGSIMGAGVVSRTGIDGERQRFNLAHELGHIVLKVKDSFCTRTGFKREKAEEKAAHRFAGAFLATKSHLLREVGSKRAGISLEEVKGLRSRYGMSMGAVLYRLKDLGVISENHHRDWCVNLRSKGWDKGEPESLPEEESNRFERCVYRAFVEGYLGFEAAEAMLKKKLELEPSPALLQKRSFRQLPVEVRRELLAKQAEELKDSYKDLGDLPGGEIVES